MVVGLGVLVMGEIMVILVTVWVPGSGGYVLVINVVVTVMGFISVV